MRAIEHAAVVTALELLRARTAAEVEQRLRGSLVAELLNSDGADIAALLGRARRLGWDLSGEQVLLAVRCVERDKPGSRPMTERLLSAVDRFVAGVSPRPLTAVHRGDLVLVWARDARGPGVDGEITEVAARLVDLLTAEEVVERALSAVAPPAAVRTCPGFSDAAWRAGVGRRRSFPAVIDLQEIAIDHLLLQLDDPEGLRAFARSVLGPALDYDRERSTELVHTARVLLEHDLDRRAAAAALHLHPNTVQQRTRRLEELTGLRLAKPRDLLRLTASLTVAQIAGLR